MTRLRLAGLAGAFLLASVAANAQGFSVTITLNENCNGNLSNSAGFSGALPCGMFSDPGPGGLAAAMTYDLLNPPGLVAGDLILQETAGGLLSDILRFNPSSPFGGNGSAVFYSDLFDGVDALADTGFPDGLYGNTLLVVEAGAEGFDGFLYTPTAGQPGFVAGAAGPVTYVIQSDTATPEPTSVALFLVGAGVLFARKYGFQRKRVS